MNRRKPALIVGVVLASIVTLSLIAHAAIITSGLAGRWIFNEASGITAYDSSGYSNNATISGSASFIADPLRGQILSITGISGGANIPYNQDLEPRSGTVSVWVKPTLAVTGDVVRHNANAQLRCNKYSQVYAYGLRVSSNGQPVAIFVNDDPKSCLRSPQYVVSGSANQVPLNKWTLLAATWDGVGTLNLYANGKLVGKLAYKPNPTLGLSYYGATPMIVGANTGGNLEFQGSVSDLRVYSRALSAAEIGNIYNGQ